MNHLSGLRRHLRFPVAPLQRCGESRDRSSPSHLLPCSRCPLPVMPSVKSARWLLEERAGSQLAAVAADAHSIEKAEEAAHQVPADPEQGPAASIAVPPIREAAAVCLLHTR